MTGYTTVTEIPGAQASPEQLARLFHRYAFAATFSAGKDVLEVACGAGMGLGYLERVAHTVVGGDIDENLIARARAYYAGRSKIEIRRLDAHQLPFLDQSFDVVLLFEAIYYLTAPEKFLEEAFRILRPRGTLAICSVNREWRDFNPSPFSTRYFSALELAHLVARRFPHVELSGAFPAGSRRAKEKLLSLLKRTAVKFGLIPKTMKEKELFKRIAFGSLAPIPPEIGMEFGEFLPPIPLEGGGVPGTYKVIYALGIKS